MNIFFYPHYVNIKTTKPLSPWLYEELEARGIALEEVFWQGLAEVLMRIQTPSIVRASSVMTCDEKTIATICEQKGHFLFYDSFHITTKGRISGKEAHQALCDWLDQHT